jgi:DNA-binding Lrp family transcriptional regulator
MNAKRPPSLDDIDIKILAALQGDGRSTVEKLAQRVALSSRACLERVRRLEAAGIITGYRAVIELAQLSKPINVFAEVLLEKHAQQGDFERRVETIEEIVECWEVSGTVDYIARFVCLDLASYQTLTTKMIDDPKLGITRIISHVALRAIRPFSGYPVSLFSRKLD